MSFDINRKKGMVFSKTGRVQDDFYVLGHTWMPSYLLDGERPVLFEAGLTCLGRIYEEAIRSTMNTVVRPHISRRFSLLFR